MIKQFIVTDAGNHVVVRLNTYGSQLNSFEELFAVAKRDFPNLVSSNVTIVHYGGKRISGYFGIEFLTQDTPPEEYTEVNSLEPTL